MRALSIVRPLVLSLALAAVSVTGAWAADPPTEPVDEADPGKPGEAANPMATKTVSELVALMPPCEALATCPPIVELLRRGDAVWPALKAGLTHADEMVRFWSLGVLSERPMKTAQAAITARLDDSAIRVRAAAAYALGAQKDKAVTPGLIKALKDKDLNVRFAAAVGLARVKDPAAVEALIVACRDKDEDVRAYSALALGDIGDARGLPALHMRLKEDLIPTVRGFAAMALSKMPSAASYEPLTAAVKMEDDAKALAAAIHALGELKDERSLPLLEGFLKHKNAEVREYAADAIAVVKGLPAPSEKPAEEPAE